MNRLKHYLAKRRGMKIQNGPWKVKVMRGGRYVVAHTGNYISCQKRAKQLAEPCVMERGSK